MLATFIAPQRLRPVPFLTGALSVQSSNFPSTQASSGANRRYAASPLLIHVLGMASFDAPGIRKEFRHPPTELYKLLSATPAATVRLYDEDTSPNNDSASVSEIDKFVKPFAVTKPRASIAHEMSLGSLFLEHVFQVSDALLHTTPWETVCICDRSVTKYTLPTCLKVLHVADAYVDSAASTAEMCIEFDFILDDFNTGVMKVPGSRERIEKVRASLF